MTDRLEEREDDFPWKDEKAVSSVRPNMGPFQRKSLGVFPRDGAESIWVLSSAQIPSSAALNRTEPCQSTE